MKFPLNKTNNKDKLFVFTQNPLNRVFWKKVSLMNYKQWSIIRYVTRRPTTFPVLRIFYFPILYTNEFNQVTEKIFGQVAL